MMPRLFLTKFLFGGPDHGDLSASTPSYGLYGPLQNAWQDLLSKMRM